MTLLTTAYPIETKIKPLPLKVTHWLLVLGVLCTGLGAAFGPWIWHASMALQITGPGLAEFVKFLPEIRGVQIQIDRLYFLYPLFLTILMLPLFAVNKTLTLPIWLRWFLRASGIPIALAGLSPVWTPTILRAEEFRLQTIIAVAAIGLAVIAPLFKKVSLSLWLVLWLVGGGVALALPWHQFALLQVPLENVYQEPIVLGWGWWLTVGGFTISLISGGWLIFDASKLSRNVKTYA